MSKKKGEAAKNARFDTASAKSRVILLPLLALALSLVVEGLNRASVAKLFRFITERPVYFLYNYLIILTSLTFSELFKRRKSVLYTVCVAWIALGIAEFMVAKERTQPFTSMDVLMLKDAITLTTIYYTWPQIILMYGSIFLAAVLLIYIVTRLPRRRQVNYTLALSSFCGFLTLCFCSYALGVHFGAFPRYFDNLVDAYDQYGFAACFTATLGNMGVSKPSDYSTEIVTGIVEEIDEETPHVFSSEDNLDHPNVIYLQLESLFDVNTVIGSRYSEDPTPNFNRLSRECPSGELYVPSIGGGTANTEFEMLSGLNIDFFGAGEYPYTTILHETTCETIAYNLRAQGYSATALHNHTGTFYGRNEVYSRLGFDHFVSLEYMPYVTYTEVGWAQDGVMADEIMKALKASGERDFIMAITVESHGKYDENYVYHAGDPEILELPEQINANRFASYLHLIHETDAFLGKLIDKLEKFDEPTVCVIYGDHLPSLDLTADVLTTNNLYASRYIIWNNYGAEFEAPDVQAYRVSANLLKQLGIPGGLITKYHQSADPTDTDQAYLDNLEVLEYDVLYGDKSAYEGENPYPVIDMTMGCEPIEISSVSRRYGRVLVNGANFTECSVIELDGESYPTAFINSAQIVAIVPRTTEVHQVCIVQKSADGVEMGRTEPYSLDD
ncbi:MAG: LTA synthase family protein [Candidatus Faecivicinus sp.]|nr:LTA synthase family protein [Candidatus Faecivicinus sp.]